MAMQANTPETEPTPRGMTLTLLLGGVWALAVCMWLWVRAEIPYRAWGEGAFFSLALLFALARARGAFRSERRYSVRASLAYSAAYVVGWQWVVFVLDLLEWSAVRVQAARLGSIGAFFVGLAWVIWFVERAAQRYETQRRLQSLEQEAVHFDDEPVTSNPLDPIAWYYGRRSPRLNQSLVALTAYCLFFFLVFTVMTSINGCQEFYEMPAGGGEQKAIAQTVKIQKVIKKKFVVNPFSAISFKVPPIDEVKLQLTEITEHAYTVGYGEGAGAGFAGGTNKGQVRFIRLEYAGGDWDQDFGIGADVNMLIEYGVRTKQKVAKRTESRTIGQLKNFPPEKSPPMVYITGQRSISVSDSEIKVLREYITDKHGMIFGDNGGSNHFHNQFVGMMRRILPNVRPTPVPLDDRIHRIPYQIPFLPYVAPHGGKNALGWRVDGRLVCYYHPGDIGDAWADDHAGVSPEVYEACYQLGTNVIFYAHSEYARWLESRKKGKK